MVLSFTGSSSGGNLPTLENLITDITTSTSNRNLLSILKTNAKRGESGDMILASSLPGGQDPLTILDAHANTLGTARLSITGCAPVPFAVISNFCRVFDSEAARLAGDRITTLAGAIISITEEQKNLQAAIPPLFDLVTRFPPSLTYLTTVHPHFIHACVKSHHFTSALAVLSVPISEIDTSLSPLTSEDVLKYHYIGALALLGLKRYGEAAEFLELVVSVPSQYHPAAIQLEALKKLHLVQLILFGGNPSLPRYIHPSLSRYLKNTPYTAIAKVFPKTSQLNEIIEKEKKAFETECNLGLVRQVVEHAPRWSIRKLTETYVTLSLEEIGKTILMSNVENVKNIVLSMIERGEINASLDTTDTVTFCDGNDTFTPADVDKWVRAAQIQGAIISEEDRIMGRSKDFLSKVVKDKDSHGHGSTIADEELYNMAPPGLRDWDEGGF